MLVNKNCAFYDNELSIGPCMCYMQEDASVLCTVTGLPFDQMDPSRSMEHRSGNSVRILKLERDFPTSELSFTQGFMNELMTD